MIYTYGATIIKKYRCLTPSDIWNRVTNRFRTLKHFTQKQINQFAIAYRDILEAESINANTIRPTSTRRPTTAAPLPALYVDKQYQHV